MFRNKRVADTDVRITTGSLENSTIIGVMHGPSLEDVREAIHQEIAGGIKNLLSYAPHKLKQLTNADRIAHSLFACESNSASALGFAVNNSGLIVCPSIGPIKTVKHLSTGVRSDAEIIKSRNLLQAITINSSTLGLVPSYLRGRLTTGDELFAFDRNGAKCSLRVGGLGIFIKITRASPQISLILKDVFEAEFDSSSKLIGGPIVNTHDEVVGIAVASYKSPSRIVVTPWSDLDGCIQMQVIESENFVQVMRDHYA